MSRFKADRGFTSATVIACGKFKFGMLRSKRNNDRIKSKVPPVVNFRRYAKLAVMCVRLCKYSHESVASSQSEFLSVIQYSQDLATVDRGGLYFDPSEYKAIKQDRLPQEARRILQTRQEARTDKEIAYLQIVLRGIKAFTEYPQKMQRRLCQVGWYEAYEPRRAIIRQHHPPHSFYFILSGTVMVTAFDKDNGGTKLLVSLHKGMSFGELAVITKRRRQATVSTQTPTELLCISSLDFEEIFMSGGVKNVNDPDHNTFLGSVRFLRDWPVHLLAENPQACLFHYFNRGEILVRDSNRSDWIYIVKSGSLSVMKKLREVKPEIPRCKSEELQGTDDEDEDENKSFGTWRHRLYRRRTRKKRRPLTERPPEKYKNNYEMEKQLEKTLPGYHNVRERLGVIDYDTIIDDYRSRIVRNQENDKLANSVDEDAEKADSIPKLPQIKKTSKGAYLAATTSRSNRRRSSVRSEENIHDELARKQLELQKSMATQEEGRKTIGNEFDNRPPSRVTLTEADIYPMFILVQVLEKGQYFGIANMIYPDQPSVSVISNGAECIMISKKFFMEKKTETTMRNIHHYESPFPSDEAFQKQLQSYVNWEGTRKKIYQRLVGQFLEKTEKRRQFVTQFQGQYCFRTGPV
ncbi:hypothetical protein FSP39_012319 [Pinctada imbricata]|uniref:Cyclic nucleotide-binding domain-containing protein n=1 Tax=Pinctada imbricata TaxID=66713 RepID=A0AA88Y0M8_PINIB|nr:hypothetical protein FSP39_012319 [Pinctada imbricata]